MRASVVGLLGWREAVKQAEASVSAANLHILLTAASPHALRPLHLSVSQFIGVLRFWGMYRSLPLSRMLGAGGAANYVFHTSVSIHLTWG